MENHHVYQSALLQGKTEVKSYLLELHFDDVVAISKYLRDDMPCGRSMRKKLFNVGVEMLENVHRHSVQIPGGIPVPENSQAFLVHNKDDDWYITSGNVINADNADALTERLNDINNADLEQLREMYRDRIAVAKFSEKGGAGLGLMDMVLKSGNELGYELLPINDKYTYFVLQIHLSLPQE